MMFTHLPYMRTYHPSYEAAGGVPAISEVKFSLISNRGCFGGCSFCALTFHQGRIVQARSHESLIGRRQKNLTEEPDFKGYIHDVGGPTANFRSSGLCKADGTRASARTGSVCSRSHVRTCGRITAIISSYYGSCGRFRR